MCKSACLKVLVELSFVIMEIDSIVSHFYLETFLLVVSFDCSLMSSVGSFLLPLPMLAICGDVDKYIASTLDHSNTPTAIFAFRFHRKC